MPRVFDVRALNSVRYTLAVTLPYPYRNLPVFKRLIMRMIDLGILAEAILSHMKIFSW